MTSTQVDVWTAAAECGDRDAQWALAQHYAGDTTQDVNEALKWISAAARQGHVEAMLALGRAYFVGWGVARDGKEAIIWYAKAAAMGDAGAQRWLAAEYFNGGLVSRDVPRAVELWQAAAKSGDAYARYNLARLLWSGTGIERNRREAIRLFRLAAADRTAYRAIVGSLPRKALLGLTLAGLLAAAAVLGRSCGGAHT